MKLPALLLLMLSATSLLGETTLNIKDGFRDPIAILTDLGQMEIRTVVRDTSVKPWNELSPKEKVTPKEGSNLTRTGTYEFLNGATLVHTANARVQGADVLISGKWKIDNEVKGLVGMILWVPDELASDLVIEHEGVPVYPGFDKYKIINGGGAFTFRQQSTGNVLFVVSGDYTKAVLEHHDSNPKWGLGIMLTKENAGAPDGMLEDQGKMDWKVSFKE